MNKFIKRIFCKHFYILDSACIVHWPDYEPHKVGIVSKCIKCKKEKRTLYKPYDFINRYGKDAYESIKNDKNISFSIDTKKGY